jgi:hypothetical protein
MHEKDKIRKRSTRCYSLINWSLELSFGNEESTTLFKKSTGIYIEKEWEKEY